LIRSVAFCVSEPGMSNWSLRLPPTVATSTTSSAIEASELTITRQGCDAHTRAQRASAPVESRSCARRRWLSDPVSVMHLAPCLQIALRTSLVLETHRRR
jgi:hypothetical protein